MINNLPDWTGCADMHVLVPLFHLILCTTFCDVKVAEAYCRLYFPGSVAVPTSLSLYTTRFNRSYKPEFPSVSQAVIMSSLKTSASSEQLS